LQRALARLHRRRRGYDEPVGSLATTQTEEHLFTVGRKRKCRNAFEHFVSLALIKLELVQDHSVAWSYRRSLGEIKYAGLARNHAGVVTGWNRHGQDSLTNVVEVDVYFHVRLLRRGSGLSRSSRRRCSGVLGFLFLFLFVRYLLFITLR